MILIYLRDSRFFRRNNLLRLCNSSAPPIYQNLMKRGHTGQLRRNQSQQNTLSPTNLANTRLGLYSIWEKPLESSLQHFMTHGYSQRFRFPSCSRQCLKTCSFFSQLFFLGNLAEGSV